MNQLLHVLRESVKAEQASRAILSNQIKALQEALNTLPSAHCGPGEDSHIASIVRQAEYERRYKEQEQAIELFAGRGPVANKLLTHITMHACLANGSPDVANTPFMVEAKRLHEAFDYKPLIDDVSLQDMALFYQKLSDEVQDSKFTDVQPYCREITKSGIYQDEHDPSAIIVVLVIGSAIPDTLKATIVRHANGAYSSYCYHPLEKQRVLMQNFTLPGMLGKLEAEWEKVKKSTSHTYKGFNYHEEAVKLQDLAFKVFTKRDLLPRVRIVRDHGVRDDKSGFKKSPTTGIITAAVNGVELQFLYHDATQSSRYRTIMTDDISDRPTLTLELDQIPREMQRMLIAKMASVVYTLLEDILHPTASAYKSYH